MRRDSTILALALLLLATVGVARAQETALSAEALGALERFLATDCELGEAGAAAAGLIEHGAEIEPELRRLLRDGPGAALLDAVSEDLVRRWDERSVFLETDPPLGLDPAARLDVVATTRGAWIARGLQRAERGYREKAATGLAAIGSPRALGMLRGALDEVADPSVGELIRTLLERQRVLARERPEPRGGRRRPAARAGR